MDIVSACLIGCNCRWDGRNSKRDDPRLEGCIPVCPEVFAGLGIPREAAELKGGRVLTKTGADVTKEYANGARIAAEFAVALGAKKAYLRERSPSCGVKHIHDGSFTGKLIAGEGLFAKELRKRGIEVVGVE